MEPIEKEEEQVSIGEKPFIESNERIGITGDTEEVTEKRIYICPECGTLKVNMYW